MVQCARGGHCSGPHDILAAKWSRALFREAGVLSRPAGVLRRRLCSAGGLRSGYDTVERHGTGIGNTVRSSGIKGPGT